MERIGALRSILLNLSKEMEHLFSIIEDTNYVMLCLLINWLEKAQPLNREGLMLKDKEYWGNEGR